MSGRLDDEKLETLRSWGTGLAADGRPELRAAGKAILILVQEIERLQVDVWHPHQETPEPNAGSTTELSLETLAEEFLHSARLPSELDSTLRGRVGRRLSSRSFKGR